MAYQRHYEDYFLDGIHNYLPEILYGRPEQFGASAPLVAYIQSQVRQRFDLFSAGQRTFVPTFAPQVAFQTPPRVVRQPPVHFTMDALAGLTDLLNVGANRTVLAPSIGSSALQTLLGLAPSDFMEPVIVRPTTEQIEAGTTMEIVDAQEEMCAICQDTMPAGSQARCLNACDHRFHPGCIDTWFQRDVRCPTCRHDVREDADE